MIIQRLQHHAHHPYDLQLRFRNPKITTEIVHVLETCKKTTTTDLVHRAEMQLFPMKNLSRPQRQLPRLPLHRTTIIRTLPSTTLALMPTIHHTTHAKSFKRIDGHLPPALRSTIKSKRPSVMRTNHTQRCSWNSARNSKTYSPTTATSTSSTSSPANASESTPRPRYLPNQTTAVIHTSSRKLTTAN